MTLATTTASSSSKAWLRALELTGRIPKEVDRVFPAVIEEISETCGDRPALLSDAGCLTYRELAEQSSRWARWALGAGLQKGDVVCLLMPNRPEYLAIWLGITRVGGVVALLNTNLRGSSLAHSIDLVDPGHVIVDRSLADALGPALAQSKASPRAWAYGGDGTRNGLRAIDAEVGRLPGSAPGGLEGRAPTIHDPALYIYTSGTTGLPKAARVSHFRLMQWTHWFAGLADTGPGDRMYNCLPMYHSVGGVVAAGSVLVQGGSVAIREGFSASRFWEDVVRWDCTMFQYIGELCRYLVQTPVDPNETRHRIRVCCGNGLAPDVWEAFRSRFRIPHVLEFYAATEGTFSLFNVDDKVGSIGRVPPFLRHRFPVGLVRHDFTNGSPVRDPAGRCVRSETGEVGEAIGRISEDPSAPGGRFEGYTSAEATEGKVLRDVFEKGDAWYRTGDLMRKDAKGYFYFVDRIGDTYRWKGENVATTEVGAAIREFPGIRDALVYGVSIPGTDGRVGMAAIVGEEELQLDAFGAHLNERLPAYARPLFIRLASGLSMTGTFKLLRTDFVREGYDPGASDDTIYFNHPDRGFVELGRELFDDIQSGRIRL